MGRALASLNCGMCGIESGSFFRRGGFILEGCVCEGAGHRIGHDFQQLGNGGELALIELIEKLMNAILVYGHCVKTNFFHLTRT
jgi:hypothetical protein